MVKFVIKGQEPKPEPVLRVWLEVSMCGDLFILGSSGTNDTRQVIACIDCDTGNMQYSGVGINDD